MIHYDISEGVPAELVPELRSMLDEARAYDADAGFTQIDPDAPTEGTRRDIVIWLLPDDQPGRRVRHDPLLAAYLRLDIAADGVAVGEYLVRPEARSHGVTTQFVEKVGLDVPGPGGWLGTGAREIWVKARGNHPATRRFARRFANRGITRTSEEWQLIAPFVRIEADGTAAPLPTDPQEVLAPTLTAATTEEASTASALLSGREELAVRPDDRVLIARDAEGALGAAAWLSASEEELTEYGDAVVLRAWAVSEDDASAMEQLLLSVLRHERERGAAALVLLTDADEDDFVTSCRRVGFHHDRTDTMYAVRS